MKQAWVHIPAGVTTLAPGGYLARETTVALDAFVMGRYPVTNAQFAAFIAAGGYADPTYWSAAGWAQRQREGWAQPRFWDRDDWTAATHPVVGVSWHEAQAYCAWRSAVENRPVRLPTEAQWQRAAQGNDQRRYPWGDAEPDDEECNWQRLFDTTTPVDFFPQGVSPWGVWDLCGNVWEWCATGWQEGDGAGAGDQRLLRGGSWSSDSPLSLRVTNRSPRDPNTRLAAGYRHQTTVGFRVVIG